MRPYPYPKPKRGCAALQGDLLATLALKDPSKVKKILLFSGELDYQKAAASEPSTLQASSFHAFQRERIPLKPMLLKGVT